MEQCKGWWERRILSLDEYRTGANLNFAEKKVICDVVDLWRIALVDNVIFPCQDQLYAVLHYLHENFNHYMERQRPWIEDERYYLGVNLRHPPDEHEKERSFFEHRNGVRFRLFYALRWKNHVVVRDRISSDEHSLVSEFFGKADEISFDRQGYRAHFLGTSVNGRSELGATDTSPLSRAA